MNVFSWSGRKDLIVFGTLLVIVVLMWSYSPFEADGAASPTCSCQCKAAAP